MSGLQGFRAAYTTLGPVGALATIAGAVAVVVVGASLVTFTRAALTTAPDVTQAGEVAQKDDGKALDKYLAQINGRSLLIRPGHVAKAPEPEPIAETGPPPPPPPPSSYDGSRIIAMVMDTVWFEDGRKMKVGDDEKDETEVLSVNAPWDARLRWKKVEFTVPLFGRDAVVLKKGDSATTATLPDPAPAPETPATETTAAKPEKPPEEKPGDQPPPAPQPGGDKVASGAATEATKPPAEQAKDPQPSAPK